jgi:hypothetical protein
VSQERSLLADADGIHEPVESGVEGQRTEVDVGEVFHAHGRGHGRGGASCFPNDRVRARLQEGESDQDPVKGPLLGGPPFPCLFPFLFPSPFPDLSRAHDP